MPVFANVRTIARFAMVFHFLDYGRWRFYLWPICSRVQSYPSHGIQYAVLSQRPLLPAPGSFADLRLRNNSICQVKLRQTATQQSEYLRRCVDALLLLVAIGPRGV